MSAKRKILSTVAITLISLTVIVVAIVMMNFRDYGISGAKEKSYLTAELVRDALTTHMVHGIMDKRDLFLGQITRSRNIEEIWLIRGEGVTKQYGPGKVDEQPRDDVDRQVLETGEPYEELLENSRNVMLRVTIPYTANAIGETNCLLCHDVKSGDVLGAISMEFDISDMRQSGMLVMMRIIGSALLLLIIAILVTNYLINPYLELFDHLKAAIKKAVDGDYSERVETKLKDEAGDVAKWLNNMQENLDTTVTEIDNQISLLISQDSALYSSHPLIKANEIVSELADIYKFKKTIELDERKQDIYVRIATVLQEKFHIDSFNLYEVTPNGRDKVYSTLDETWCAPVVDESNRDCRACRTNSVVYSDDFPKVCEYCTLNDQQRYICIPYTISQTLDIVLTLQPKEQKDLERIRYSIHSILAYFEASKPVIESKLLMEILRESSLRDALTGLYNRKFLEEYIAKATSQALRTKTTYAVMMLDIDYFKMVNDTYGHDFGDIVIRGLAECLRSGIRESDLAIRFGGEEFIILLYNATEKGAHAVAEKVRKKFENKVFEIGKERIRKTVSIGYALFPDDGESMWRVIKFADLALYKAKNGGRNRVERFTAELKPEDNMY